MSELADRRPLPPKHKVLVGMGYTKNLGDFDSLRMDVRLEIEGKPGENPDQTYKKASDWVEARLMEQFAETVEQVREIQRGKKRG
jgi:hypothetical protein